MLFKQVSFLLRINKQMPVRLNMTKIGYKSTLENVFNLVIKSRLVLEASQLQQVWQEQRHCYTNNIFVKYTIYS